MADSDDDYDRRKRDKFRRERNDYDRRDENRRDSWEDRRGMRGNYNRQSVRSREILYNSRNNRDRREMYAREQQYDNRRRDRFSPTRHDMGQPAKRMRRDWDDNYGHFDIPFGGGGRGGGPGGMQMGGVGRPHWGHGAAPDMGGMPPHPDFTVTVGGPAGRLDVDYPTQPPMLSFKAFLSQQDDTIGEDEAIKRYNDYKLDFKKQQISEFFVAHKEEEWFKSKYHPEEFAKRQAEIRVALQNRLAVFNWLRETGRLDNLQLDVEKSEEILKILDAAVIKLEGGTDLDLTILEEPEKEETSRSRTTSENVPADKIPELEKKEEAKVEGENKTEEVEKKEKPEENGSAKIPDKPLEMAITPEQEELQKKAKEYQIQQEEQKKKGKRKKNGREKSDYSYGSESESDNGSISDAEPAPPGLEDEPPPPGMEEGAADGAEKGEADQSSANKEGKKKKENEGDEDKDVNTKPEEEEEPAPPKPRPLHRTNSIFLRNLAPTITKQEVEALCKRYPGFMRVALQDPLPERRFFRRGWATFAKNVNIKDICWNLNNIRLRDCELGATLNRELKQRVRPVNGLTVHRTVARNDIKLAARIIQAQDKKWNLWTDPEEEKKDQDKDIVFNFTSKNPVLHNITDYLVEEGSFEEEELLGTSEDDKKDGSHEVTVDREDSMLKVLDRMVLYLRLVHSIDYYNASEYPNEDEMPHRCGIVHARGMPPGSTAKITHNDVTEYMTNFENKLKSILETATPLTDEEAHRLGRKNPDTEVEKFVQANTQELAKDKWLCPLSGKKFKGPDFVRKHIFNKHAEKVEEVKKEVTFFNNYLMDAKRPGLPEHPGNRPPPPPPPREPPPQQQQPQPNMAGGPAQVPPSMMGYGGGRQPLPLFGGNMPSFGGPMYGHQDLRDFGRARGGGRGYGGRRSDPRPIIEYRDLDAPDEMDIF